MYVVGEKERGGDRDQLTPPGYSDPHEFVGTVFCQQEFVDSRVHIVRLFIRLFPDTSAVGA